MKALKDKKIKYILIIAAVVFALFLCIYYWPNISSLIGVLLSATTPLLLGCAIAYPLNILMSFYERHFFPNSKKKFICKTRRAISLILAVLTLLAIIALIVLLVVPQLVSCVKLIVAELPGAMDQLITRLEEFDILSDDVVDKLA